ncbi:MAG TPA: hypothetical protein VEI97_01185 [bacterium]|nr:hypothetical protein [bacterium]
MTGAHGTDGYGEIVYGEYMGSLLFLPVPLANQRIAIFEALNSAATWGEFRREVPEELWADIVATWEDEGERVPAVQELFDPDLLPGYSAGDWPRWPDSLDWVPLAVKELHQQGASSLLEGPYLEFDPELEERVVDLFESLGYGTVRDDALIDLASGGYNYSFDRGSAEE